MTRLSVTWAKDAAERDADIVIGWRVIGLRAGGFDMEWAGSGDATLPERRAA